MIKIRWTGAAGTEITFMGKTILIDPFLSRPSKKKVLFHHLVPDRNRISRYLKTIPGKPVTVIASHTHYDHAMDIPDISFKTRADIIGSNSLSALMRKLKISGRVNELKYRETFSPDRRITVNMIPSLHGNVLLGRVPFPGDINAENKGPMKCRDYRVGQVFIPKIVIDGKTIMHVGSAAFMEEELQGESCDILLLCVPGWKKFPGYPERIAEILRPKTIIPFHTDNMFVSRSGNKNIPEMKFLDKKGFVNQLKLKAPDCRILTPIMFKEMLL